MAPDDLEQRLAEHEKRIQALESDLKATDAVLQLLIGSHPDLETLLLVVQATIERGKKEAGLPSQNATIAGALARLEDVERRILALMAGREQRALNRAAVEKHRSAAKEQALADLGMDIGRGRAGGHER